MARTMRPLAQLLRRMWYSWLWASIIYFLVFLMGLALFIIGWLFTDYEILVSAIGIEIMGGAVTFYVVSLLWEHPHDAENGNRIETLLHELEEHRVNEAAHIIDSAAQMETVVHLLNQVQSAPRAPTVGAVRWRGCLLVVALVGVVGAFLLALRKR